MQVELMQGDCLELMNKIPDGSVDMVLCDLPYATTRNKWDNALPLEKLWVEYCRVCKQNAAIVLFSQPPFDKVLAASNLALFRYEWIWEKPKATGFLNSKKMPLKAHENILVFYKKLQKFYPQGLKRKDVPTINKGSRGSGPKGAGGYNYDRATRDAVQEFENYPRDVLRFSCDTEHLHPTQKPVPLLEYLIKTYTNPDDVVLDNCMGSGGTGVACVNTGRRFIGIELDSGYFEIAKTRIEKAEVTHE